ncbi:putative nucleotidyltransferase [Limihaloglobus sulfuriphilus]|uniref:Putative nucleotidyltransferase n=1 Tax=Limihaloglobus sulfuriphilus TaxID=1851148 RepID=A0A1Q2MHE6_9BACT|nr:nucleotidyltransferase domain-containing protein [Limihaloglobus sulfuriphilus]AQQ71958.1 putative nucleotidyltransferase [Limihaloglobus sulfuriphilus]
MYKLSEKAGQLDPKVLDILPECTRKVRNYDTDAAVILYGSQARGKAGKDSDMDMLILLSHSIPAETLNKLHDDIYETSLANDIVISCIIKPRSSWENLSHRLQIYIIQSRSKGY